MAAETKVCNTCQRELPVAEFYPSARDGYQSKCKACKRAYNAANRDLINATHRRYRKEGAATPRERMTLGDYLRIKTARGGADECWLWIGRIDGESYGWAELRGRHMGQAHRLVYEMEVGPIPDGLQLDHVCHNADLSCVGGKACLHRRCVNPNHLEPVTQLENRRRVAERTARVREALRAIGGGWR